MTRMSCAATCAALTLAACNGDEPLELPAPIEQSSPFVYPEDLWDQGVEGQAIVMVHVSERGTVDSVYVRSTSGYESMDSAAVQGARTMRFRPARRGEDNVDAWVRLPVRFSKNPPAPGATSASAQAAGAPS